MLIYLGQPLIIICELTCLVMLRICYILLSDDVVKEKEKEKSVSKRENRYVDDLKLSIEYHLGWLFNGLRNFFK